jgi:hypothetical protein
MPKFTKSVKKSKPVVPVADKKVSIVDTPIFGFWRDQSVLLAMSEKIRELHESVKRRIRFLERQIRLEENFAKLAETWYLETLHSSGYLDKILHTAYQQIIGLGKDVIPFILRELQDEPSEWFWALRALTGEDPTTEDMAGKRDELAEAWLNWGKENGYI